MLGTRLAARADYRRGQRSLRPAKATRSVLEADNVKDAVRHAGIALPSNPIPLSVPTAIRADAPLYCSHENPCRAPPRRRSAASRDIALLGDVIGLLPRCGHRVMESAVLQRHQRSTAYSREKPCLS